MSQKILVVDDEQDLRDALSEALIDAGYEVVKATNGQECVELALVHKPDLILLDIMMPHMDGHQALKEIRKDPWGKNVKVLMLTVSGDPTHISNAVAFGSDDYLIKSNTSLSDILKKVKQALAGYGKK
jgi:CheY-like chemotaxis protein